MSAPTLVILAAGMASRYGSQKQTEGFGPNGETIMDYSIYDAIEAGFGKVVFIIREEFAEQFKLPVVHLVDNPGFMVGLEAERTGTIRYGVEAMNAVYKATIPWASVIVRRAYGIAGSAMSNAERYQYRYCWPSGDWGSLPIAGGLEVAYKSELEAADDPAALLEEIRARLAKVTSPFRSAERFNVEDIIDPRDTRPLLCEFAGLAWRRLGVE